MTFKKHMDTTSDIILLMTATVDPRGCPGAARFSVPERLAQYKKAFAFYVDRIELAKENRKGFNKIVFCENSGFDLSEFAKIVPEEKKGVVEFMSFNPDDFLPSRGKARNEELILDKAVDHSKFLRDGDPFIFKVTGRYSILNIGCFTKEIRKKLPDLDFYCDVRDHKLYSTLGLKWSETWCDSRHIGFRVSFYRQHIYGRYEELDDSSYKVLELQMFALSRAQRKNPRVCHRSRYELYMDGYNGNKSQLFNIPVPAFMEKPYLYLRSLQKDILRKLLPSFWF